MSQIPSKPELSALDAITEAQKIAFAPVLFQTAWCLRETGLLACLDQHPEGISAEAAAQACDLTLCRRRAVRHGGQRRHPAATA